ncbi:MAG: UDP-N-acetylmuramate--L-alanine ligase [Bacteroidia bacterium]|nr:UDP-N-acetylmuramate--L-alanine ligase [Bacteroidia bacterium]
MTGSSFHSVVFLGIGGIGMSALARYFNQQGKAVFGYDKTPTHITNALEAEGMTITFTDDVRWLDKILEGDLNGYRFIYTPAIPDDLQLKQHLLRKDCTLLKRSQALGLVTDNTTNLSIAGTHGKTTTSCILNHILQTANIPSVAFLGGISSNYGSNYINSLNETDRLISVTEADEFDRSFLQLHPFMAAITSMDADHLDIYGDASSLTDSFKEFANQVNPSGKLFVHTSLQNHFPENDIITYGIGEGSISAQHVHIHDGSFVFDLYHGDTIIRNLVLGIAGRHNVENAVVACAMALEMGATEQDLRKALVSFTGVKRRFEFVVKEPTVYIDDYAHHPTELNATISSLRQLYPTKRITGIFQPHLYSRTRDFLDGFAESLSQLDEAWLMDIYPAREEPIPGITSKLIFDKITSDKVMVTREDIVNRLATNTPEVLVTLGAGDIDKLVEPIKNQLLSQ